MPAFRLACLAYLSIALPSSTLGLLWPPMRLSFHEPVRALGIVLIFGIAASVVASAATGHALSRVPVGAVVAMGTLLMAAALAAEARAAGTTRTVSLQVAASAIGSAVVPACLGLVIGALGARTLAPSLLLLGLAMCGVCAALARRVR